MTSIILNFIKGNISLFLTLLFITILVIVGLILIKNRWGRKTAVLTTISFFVALCGFVLYLYFIGFTSNPHNYKTVGEVSTPLGYKRVECKRNSMGAYLRDLPLMERGSKVHLYKGGLARLQNLSYAVVNQSILSNDEQCADVCLRLRAEYLYSQKRYSDIHFKNVNNKTLQYSGSSRKAFEAFMRGVYGTCSTASMYASMPTQKIASIQPGDVLVYKARKGRKYGHAVMIADVAVSPLGKKAVLIVEGNTPARQKHLLRNPSRPFSTPWFFLDDDDEIVYASPFYFNIKNRELKTW